MKWSLTRPDEGNLLDHSDKFIEEQVKICHELAAFGGPEG